jgi:hypothetical protein
VAADDDVSDANRGDRRRNCTSGDANADAHSKRDAYRPDPDADKDRDADGDLDPHRFAHADRDVHTHTAPDADGEPDANLDADAHVDLYPASVRHADGHARSSALHADAAARRHRVR